MAETAFAVRIVKHDKLLQGLTAELAAAVREAIEDWQRQDKVRRLWARDATLWTGRDEARWLGWLDVVAHQLNGIDHLKSLAKDTRDAGFRHAVLLGMGGSSLCPEVLRMTFGRVTGYPELRVLDSTDPAQVRMLESGIDLAKTLFIVASKSGSTLEPHIFMQYFLARVRDRVGEAQAARHFMAITDPGSQLEHFAHETGFRHVVTGEPSIGGRYSALSAFGLVPAAIMGLDVTQWLARAQAMVHACEDAVPAPDHPAVVLGAIMGVAHNHGRNKLTVACSPGITEFGAWLEQLIAESTGKSGKAVLPIDREPLARPEVYGRDRLFVYLRLTAAPDAQQDRAIERLVHAGQPVVRIELNDAYDLAAEFFRWEFATAVAGAVIGIHPFDQPDVEAAKVEARRLTSAYEQSGKLPGEPPLATDRALQVFADAANATALVKPAGALDVTELLRAHLARLGADDYFCLLAFIEMNADNERLLQQARLAVRDARHVATSLGFGPRFLHSTGQAHKGGPASGVFLQVTCDDAHDLPVPGSRYSFGVVKAAQAGGDFAVLAARGRRLLRVHLKGDVRQGLAQLAAVVRAAVVPA